MLEPPPGRLASLIRTRASSSAMRAQHEKTIVLSWQSAVPPPPSPQLLAGVNGFVDVLGRMFSVYHPVCRCGPPPPPNVCVRSGSQRAVGVGVGGESTKAFIRSADPRCVSACAENVM